MCSGLQQLIHRVAIDQLKYFMNEAQKFKTFTEIVIFVQFHTNEIHHNVFYKEVVEEPKRSQRKKEASMSLTIIVVV